ncbi:MAG TPA: universal stress protein [candidate division Zixibacteria bacterium]|nr:universal stress protein [candidate division Zixibacteria bacterium]
MIFGRRPEKRAPLLSFERILVPLAGTEADDVVLRLVALLASGHGEVVLLHVIEVPFERQLDAEDPRAIAFADEVLERAQKFLQEHEVDVRTSIAQARAAGAAIVDDAVEQGADLIVMGLRYKKRFGGGWDAGRTVPYVMRNATAPVWCLRAETEDLAYTP